MRPRKDRTIPTAIKARCHSIELKQDLAWAIDACGQLLRCVVPKRRESIIEWVGNHVDLSYDITANASGKVQLYPYQIEPLRQTENPDVRQIDLMFAPRCGKSAIWKFALLKRIYDGNCAGLIVYPSLDMGLKTNKDTLEPLIRSIPEFSKDLSKRGSITKDSYRLMSSNSVIYFLGGGSQLINYTCGFGIIDELDQVTIGNTDEQGENIDQLRALRIRMQTYMDRLLMACSSPTTYGGLIYGSFKQGSRHVYNLRCKHCGNLTPANQLAFPLTTGKYAGLQWLKDDNENVIADSIRWICPICVHEHPEAEAVWMAENGCYVPENPEEKEHLSYQVSALANPWLFPWRQIAEAQEDATDTSGRKHLKNSILGMPYEPRRANDHMAQSIPDVLSQKSAPLPSNIRDTLAVVTCGIDQQATGLNGTNYYVYSVRGWDEQGNSWSLAHGLANTTDELTKIVNATYCGQKPLLCMIDAGGFAGNEQRTDPFVYANRNVVYYKGGDSRTLALQQGQTWRFSDNVRYLALCNAIHYQEKLLDLIYGVQRPVGYQWHMPAQPDRNYISQMAAMKPNTRMKDGRGEAFANWNPTGERHDYFDTEKMSIAALDVALQIYRPEQWARGRIPAFLLAELLRRRR